MTSGKLAIVVAEQALSWISCQSISNNLRKAYELAARDRTRVFPYPGNASRIDTLELARRIREYGPERVIFLDHLPHPWLLVHALDTVIDTEAVRGPRPDLVFHVYGDFTLYPFEWMSLDTILRKYRAAFITASPRQAALVGRLLAPGSASVPVSGFPVDANRFHASAELRASTRELLKAGRDPLIVYTGRLSLQKNAHKLLAVVGGLFERFEGGRFCLAGPVDDITFPLFHAPTEGFEYRRLLGRAIDRLPPAFRERIHLIGCLGAADLAALYNAADLFISPSLHHDEDFGMAPAEALMCGVPAVLSDWGGYAQFIETGSDGLLVPVELGERNLVWDPDAYYSAALMLLLAKEPYERRVERSERFARRCSIEAVARKLGEIHQAGFRPFTGFSPLMQRLREAHRDNRVPFPEGPKKGTLYEELYTAYLRPAGTPGS